MNTRAVLTLGVVVTLLALGAFWIFRGDDEPVARLRTVAFDNLYGNVTQLPVHVSVDGQPEQAMTAECSEKTCTFSLQLTNAVHNVAISVEQNGRRSAPARVTLDTTNAR
jgi:hypothetical protein